MKIIKIPACIKSNLLIAALWIMLSCSPGSIAKESKPMNYPEDLQSRLSAALKAKGSEYKPRTKHLDNDQPVYINRLIFEDSPYLLQHAHNPVNWFPWSEEAFAKARLENKPVFLSIGYATCHWCHVMEEESFENIQVAEILNEHFIAIKVDREQYPDIDQTYMTAVTLLTGQGGWPMSSFLTYEGKPFYGGTYYPAATFSDLLLQINRAWKNQPQVLTEQAEKLADAVHQANSTQEQISTLELTAVQSAVDSILSHYDKQEGGFSQAPKFPNEPMLLLLLQAAQRQPSEQLLSALNHTLSAMAQGGIYDQVGGGFHRYATDNQWLVPHFEKMLYNQAYLARVYAHGYRLTGNQLYARIVRQTLDYVLREMTAENGGFYSATDADSEGHEGTYFIWTEGEISTLLGAEDGAFIKKLFGTSQHGNFEGKNILYLPDSLNEVAKQQDITLEKLLAKIDPLLEKLRKYRDKRIPPLTDDKIIVAWNSMLITALVEAGDIINEPRYLKAGERAADAIWRSQRVGEGILWRVNLDGKASIPGRQDDYVHFIEALLSLYDVTGKSLRLQQARSLAAEMLEKFRDPSSGALVMGRDSLLFTQPKDAYDGALPSGNAVAVRVLNRLARRTVDSGYNDSAGKILQSFSSSILRQPAGYAYMLAQLSELRSGETGPRQYAARGAVKIDSRVIRQQSHFMLEITLTITDGWHINAHQPLQEYLIATNISLKNDQNWELSTAAYPDPVLVPLKFAKESLALYQGQITIQATIKPKTQNFIYPLALQIQLQACNQELCLPPEDIGLLIYEASV